MSTIISYPRFCNLSLIILYVVLYIIPGNILWADSISVVQLKEDDGKTEMLYKDLGSRINEPNAVLSERWIFKIHYENRDMWLVFLSETLNGGCGVIGSYDDEMHFKEMIKVHTILSIQPYKMNKDFIILAVKTVHGEGTGYWSEAIALYNPLDLHSCLWTAIINEDTIGPVKKNCSASQLRTSLRFLDIDCDGIEELMMMKTICWIPKESFSISESPELTLEIYKYNKSERKFSRIENLGQAILE